MPQLMPMNWCLYFFMFILLMSVFFMIYFDYFNKNIYNNSFKMKMFNKLYWKW